MTGVARNWPIGLGIVVILAAALSDPRLAAIFAVWLGLWAVNAWLASGQGNAARWVVPVILSAQPA